MATILTTHELSRRFGGVTAVNNVSLKVEKNGLLSIIGPNGAGKTTLFNVITGRIPASSGQVFYQGHNITNKAPHRIVKLGISRTFQKSSIFYGSTVLENVRIAKQAKIGGSLRILSSKEKLKNVNEGTWAILEQLGLTDQAEIPASTLSHGDQRLLEIGIALAGDPRVLLLDEPTSGMSPRETERTTKLVRRLTGEIAIILVEHDMEVVMSISDRISVMHQGKIIADGTPEEIQQNELVKEAYLGKEE
ncbi:MAG: ABC transporter ATP-binding protein [Deltaproteobacteria bacterium]|nr:ABC transporter ATP-binding protein [Deltaproteobacteria bacterium]